MSDKNKHDETNAARAARAAYYRDWRKRNPGKNAEYVKRYWVRKAQQMESENQTEQ